MVSGLRTLLTGILDYAGLFPPAKLPFDQAIRQYARYQRDPDCWMLGRFICPTLLLEELAPFIHELFSESSLEISALGRGGRNVADFLAGHRADLAAVAAFRDHHSGRVELSAYEARVPSEVLAGSTEAARALLDAAMNAIEAAKLPGLTPYYEVSLEGAWRTHVKTLGMVLAGRRRRAAGFKLRCGGLEGTDFPSPEQVAFTITSCRDAGVPLKFTAGLHHPIRHFDAGLNIYVHGFLNVFGAGVLAHARQLSESRVQRIVEDEDPNDFAFTDEGLRWKDLHATVAEIRAARRCAVISFGSCSFEEPRDGLRALGLLN
jgi:hypothetical protein